jgi:hypothetical protein
MWFNILFLICQILSCLYSWQIFVCLQFLFEILVWKILSLLKVDWTVVGLWIFKVLSLVCSNTFFNLHLRIILQKILLLSIRASMVIISRIKSTFLGLFWLWVLCIQSWSAILMILIFLFINYKFGLILSMFII